MAMSRERAMWSLFEPIHVVTYFTPAARDAFAAAGLRGFWRGYFAGRAAPLGPVGPAPVVATFYNFCPRMVQRALPEVWTMASPERVLQARADGAVAALREFLPPETIATVAAAVELLEAGVAALEPAGRVLGAANQALPLNDDPLARLWQATTTLREHRGDGHVDALVAANLGPLDVLILRTGLDTTRDRVQPARGWTDEEWAQAQERVEARGLVDASGKATTDGRDLVAWVESATDVAASQPWQALGVADTQRLSNLLLPMAQGCRRTIPDETPIGMPTPTPLP